MKTKSFVRLNKAKNRIYITLEGSHDIAEAERMYHEYASAIEQCRPGFTVLVDVSSYVPGSEEVQKIHKDAAHFAESHYVGKVARVVGDTPLGGMQIDRIVKHEAGYETRHFRSVEDAEDFLDGAEE